MVVKKIRDVLAVLLAGVMTIMSVSGCGQVMPEGDVEMEKSDAIQIGVFHGFVSDREMAAGQRPVCVQGPGTGGGSKCAECQRGSG